VGFFFLIRHIANEVISGEKVLITFLSNLNRSLLRLVSQRSIDIWVRLGESWIHWSHGFIGSWGVVLPVPVQEEESLRLEVLGASSLALWM